MLCEHIEYVWNVPVYCGKMDPLSGFGHAETVVLQLMEKLLDRGHALYVDNFYTVEAFSGSSTKSKNVDFWNIEEKQKTPTKKNCFYKTEKRTAHCKTKRAYYCRKVAR